MVAEDAMAIAKRLADTVLPEWLVTCTSNSEVNFEVPLATVMSLSLAQFSIERASPQEVMPRLSNIFTAFQQRSRGFQGMTIVRRFAGTMLCAAGLFGQCGTFAAENMIAFAMDCIEIIEDLNVKTYAEHTVQIGIDTGGPIICGVLGDRSGFDIIGRPIHVAQMMRLTAPQNTIQISDATYSHATNTGYPATRRNVSFAGKNYATYLLRSAELSESSPL
jgi:class 3 adenylate cyclase